MKPIVVIVGPTAVGKSSLALALARTYVAEIVSADALQVYRGLDIGTAKPSPEEQQLVRHHLIDILDPGEQYSAGVFAAQARKAIGEIQGRGRLPLVVGGSGLYVRALVDGIGPLPPSEPAVRQELQRRLQDEGLQALHEELSRRDPPSARRLPPGDTQRILRALEVLEVSGRPLSEWISASVDESVSIPAVRIGLTLSRTVLYDRIASRVGEMVRQGWVDEVSRLLADWKDPDLPAFQAIGYRQIARHLLEGWSLEEAIEDTVGATLRFSKRQMTWFRKDTEIEWFEADAGPPHDTVRTFLEEQLATVGETG
jgi:tRNA dimethylallyltransferase